MSDKVTIKVEGIEKAIKDLKRYQVVKKGAVKIALKESGLKVETAAKEMCVVDTGRLRGSISTNWSGSGKPRGQTKSPAKADDGVGQPIGEPGMNVAVGSNVKYARRIEHGFVGKDSLGRNYNQKGQPYLFPAYFMHEGEAIKRIGKIFKKKD